MPTACGPLPRSAAERGSGPLENLNQHNIVDNYAQVLASLPTPGVYFGPQIGWLGMPVWRWVDLVTLHEGPCIIEAYDATCVVLPQLRGELDAYGKIVLNLLSLEERYYYATRP